MDSPSVPPAIKEALSAMEPAMKIACVWIILASLVEASAANERDRCIEVVTQYDHKGNHVVLEAKVAMIHEIRNPTL